MVSARLKAYLALSGSALIWGAAQPLVKPALHFVAPIQYMFLRYAVALPIGVYLFTKRYRQNRPSHRTLLKIFGIESLTLLTLVILYTGLSMTTALQSSLIINARPIFFTLMGIMLLREHEETHEWLGLLLSVVGTAMVIIGPYLNHQTLSFDAMLGNTLIVVTNILATINTYFCKKTYQKLDKVMISSFNVIIGFVFFTLYNLFVLQSLPFGYLANSTVLIPVLYMAILGTMLANTLQIYGYNTIEASEASLFHYLEPLVYVPLAIFWLQEPLNPLQFIGLSIIILGVFIAAYRFKVTRSSRRITQGLPLKRLLYLPHNPFSRPRPVSVYPVNH